MQNQDEKLVLKASTKSDEISKEIEILGVVREKAKAIEDQVGTFGMPLLVDSGRFKVTNLNANAMNGIENSMY